MIYVISRQVIIIGDTDRILESFQNFSKSSRLILILVSKLFLIYLVRAHTGILCIYVYIVFVLYSWE